MAFLWVIVYGLTLGLMQRVADRPWLRGCLPVAFCVAFLLWIIKTGRLQQAGLGKLRLTGFRQGACLLVLMLLPVCNLVCSKGQIPAASFCLEMLGVCLAEELFFRGFLLGFLSREKPFRGMVLSSLLFALMHLANLLSGADPLFTGLQAICGFAVGLCYCAVTLRFGSLLPCTAAHFLTNIFGTGSAQGAAMITGLLVCTAVYGLCGLGICPKTQEETL